MEQDVINLYASESSDDYSEYTMTYTPDRILNWNRGYESPDSLRSVDMILHEMCHIMDFMARGQHKRLLLSDYGFRAVDVIPHSVVRMEVFVLCLQHAISLSIFGVSMKTFSQDSLLKTFQTTKRVWKHECKLANAIIESKGLPYYYAAWDEAIAFIAANRKYP